MEFPAKRKGGRLAGTVMRCAEGQPIVLSQDDVQMVLGAPISSK